LTAAALGLVLASAASHAVWNWLVKASPDKAGFLWWIQIPAIILYLPLVLVVAPWDPIPAAGWIAIVASAVLHVLYTLTLGKAYEAGDLSLVYPLARSAPLFVPVWAILFLGEHLTAAGISGIVLIVAGAYVLGLRSLSLDAALAPLLALRAPGYLWAALTAFIISVYSVVDKYGVRYVHPLRYMYLMDLLALILLTAIVVPPRRTRLPELMRAAPATAVVTGILRYGSYALILYAFTLSQVSYVTAARQVSILMGVGLGSLVLREEAGAGRLVAAVLMLLGILLITVRG
jgi:drug/metabolite transporter (DMT)-like permease